MAQYDIAQNQATFDIGFFPTSTWQLTEANYGVLTLPTFNWVQAFWDTTDLGASIQPALVVSMGHTDSDSNLICNYVPFAYSGERVPIKGKIIVASGVDRFGNAITATPIDAGSPTDSLILVMAHGGQY